MLDNLTILGHFYELEHQIALKFAENLSQGEILAELEQNFAELEQKFAELGQNLALSQGPNTQKKPDLSVKYVHINQLEYHPVFAWVLFRDGRKFAKTHPTWTFYMVRGI